MSDPNKAPIGKISSEAYFRERKIEFTSQKITAEDIHNGALSLNNFDVFYMLGGFAPNYFNALGDLGHAMI
jgi:hypothetical protein